MGVSFRRMMNNEPDALEPLARWGNLHPTHVAELLSWTGEATGDVRTRFCGEIFGSRALRNPVMRGCPACLREDAQAHPGNPLEVMAMRGDWQLREVSFCLGHRQPLVPLWSERSPEKRFDIGARLQEIIEDLLSGAMDQPNEEPSEYDMWLDNRLSLGSDDSWLGRISLYAATTICRLLGMELLRLEGVEQLGEANQVRQAQAMGFAVLQAGPQALDASLARLAEAANGKLDEPRKAFGALFQKLSIGYLEDEAFAPFRIILRDQILAVWPVSGGQVVLGEALPTRRLHSLVTAARETGVGAKVLEQFLVEAGALAPDDPRPNSRRTFDAQRYSALLAEIPTLVGSHTMRRSMGATKMEFTALETEGFLTPRTRVTGIKAPWRISDGLALVNELQEKAIPFAADDPAWETILHAARRRELGIRTIIASIRSGEIQVVKRAGIDGFNGLCVWRADVDRLAKPVPVEESSLSGTIAAAAFGRAVGMRDKGLFLAFVKAGHTPTAEIEHPKTRQMQHRMTPGDGAAFHRRYLTPTTIESEFGLHRNTSLAILKAGGVARFSPDGVDYGAIWLRSEAAPLIAAFLKS